MENNRHTLKKALTALPDYEPPRDSWENLCEKLDEIPLHEALVTLPYYEPDEAVWAAIERKSAGSKPYFLRYFVAAVVLMAAVAGIWMSLSKPHADVKYSQIGLDERLALPAAYTTDREYERLKTFCETNTMVCENVRYKRLQTEFETLHDASAKLQEVIGAYNTEPQLVQQLDAIETQKAQVLNEMAKLI